MQSELGFAMLFTVLVVAALLLLWLWAYYHHVKSSRCYRRVEIAEMAILKLPATRNNREKVLRLIERASAYSYNRSTEAMIKRTVERFNQKFVSHERENSFLA